MATLSSLCRRDGRHASVCLSPAKAGRARPASAVSTSRGAAWANTHTHTHQMIDLTVGLWKAFPRA
eukprot:10764991-Alexandrium_andersonii.AAC.1